MKQLCIALLVASLLTVTACGDTKVINGIEYDTYGLISENEEKDPAIKYKPIWGNIIWGVILIETIIAPIYFFGFSMFEPVGEVSIQVKPTTPRATINSE